jgi:hypothetical protein
MIEPHLTAMQVVAFAMGGSGETSFVCGLEVFAGL